MTSQSTQTRPQVASQEAPPPVLLPSIAPQAMPAVQQQPVGQPEQPVNAVTVLTALRRRWFAAILIGLPLGLAAAYAAWTFIPESYVAFSEIRVRTVVVLPPGKAPGNKKEDHKTLKQTLMKQAVSPQVINAALRDPEIARLALLKRQEDPRGWLEENVKRIAVGSEFFRISLTSDLPNDLAPIVNAITNAFKTEVLDRDNVLLDKKIKMYSSLRDDAQIKMDKMQQSIVQLASKGAANKNQFDQKQKSLAEQRLLKIRERSAVELKIRNLKLLMDFRKKEAKKFEDAKIPQREIDAYLSNDADYVALLGRIEQAKGRKLRWEKEGTANHPGLKKAIADLKKLEVERDAIAKKVGPIVKQRILDGIRSDAKGEVGNLETQMQLLVQEKTLIETELSNIKVESGGDNSDLHKLQRFEEDYSNQSQYVITLRNAIRHLKAEQAFRQKEPQVTIERKAEPPIQGGRKKRYAGTAVAGLGVMGLWIAGLVMFDIRMRRISSVQQVAERVGLSVFGAIPTMPRNATARRNGSWSTKARYWHNVLTESIDASRTMLLKEAERNNTNIFMVASAMGGEGKTTVSCHLATSLARAGRSVLLIDADMRRPFVHRTFELVRDPGFAEVLRGEAEFSEVTQESGVAGLTVLTAGQIDQATIDLLAHDRIGELFSNWRTQFDFIIVDTPPIMPVTDSLMIAQYVDGVLFAIRRDVSRAGKVSAACQRLSMLGVPILGAMAIGLSDDGYGHRYPYRYGYSSTYGESPYGNTTS